MFEVFITRKIPEAGIKILEKQCKVEINPYNRVLTKEEIIKGIKGKDGLLCLLTDPIDRDVIISEPKLKMIASYAVGYDNIDIDVATEKNIPVSNTPGVLTDATAEMAWALLFSASRRIIEGDKYTRNGKFKGWDPMLMLGQDITGKTLGIIGAGRIGTAFALKSQGFKMKILYNNNSKNNVLEEKLGAKKVGLKKILKESDFISLHVPLNKTTYHLISDTQLNLMKENAVLINTSRGPVVDEKALLKHLKKRKIFAAGLDVYENEPDIEPGLKNLDNVVLQPHSASATFQSRSKMAIIAAENMIDGLNGKKPVNCVNPKMFK